MYCTKRSLQERIGLLLEDDKLTDITFTFEGEDNIRAHRAILGSISPVFKTMLAEPWGTPDSTILIVDIDRDIFLDMIRFCYTDSLQFRDMDHAVMLLYAFKKYLIDEASQECRQFVLGQLSMDNAVHVLTLCEHVAKDEYLYGHILRYICQYADIILPANVAALEVEILSAVLASSEMNAEEVDLMRVLMEWGRFHGDGTPESCREVLNRHTLLDNLNFTGLTVEEVMTCRPWLHYLLSDLEICAVEGYVNSSSTDSMTRILGRPKRNFIKQREAACWRMTIGSGHCTQLVIKDTSCLKVTVTCDRTIQLVSFTVITQVSRSWSVEYSISHYTEMMQWSLRLDDGRQDNGKQDDEELSGVVNQALPYDAHHRIDLADCRFVMKKGLRYEFSFRWPIASGMPPAGPYHPLCRAGSTNFGVGIDFVDQFNAAFLVGLSYLY